MKNLILSSLILMFFISLGCAQKIKQDKVPGAVLNAFKVKFPGAEEVKWSMEKKDVVYEAEFEIKETEGSATFSSDGKWLETESVVQYYNLPEAVKNTLLSQYKKYKVSNIEKSETPDGVVYEVILKKGFKRDEVKISETGTILPSSR